jgi:hypothetical protein
MPDAGSALEFARPVELEHLPSRVFRRTTVNEAIVAFLALGQVAKEGAWSGTWIMLLDRAAAA